MMTTKLLYTRRDLCDVLSVSASTVDRLIKSGRLPSVRVGRGVRVTDEALAGYIAGVAPLFTPSDAVEAPNYGTVPPTPSLFYDDAGTVRRAAEIAWVNARGRELADNPNYYSEADREEYSRRKDAAVVDLLTRAADLEGGVE